LNYGANSSSVAKKLVNVSEVYATGRAFAAVVHTGAPPNNRVAYWCCWKFIQDPHQDALHYSTLNLSEQCLGLQQDWNEEIAFEICASEDMGLTDKSVTAQVCPGFELFQQRLNISLANQLFPSCESWCVYDIYSNAYKAFFWSMMDRCWSPVECGFCIGWNHPEQQAMIDYMEKTLCTIGELTTESSAEPACSLQQEWSENLMDNYCTVYETGYTYKHYASIGRAAIPCPGYEDKADDLLKSLAMKLYTNCASWCVFDYMSNAELAWRWHNGNKCWKLKSKGFCHFDYHNGVDTVEWNAAKEAIKGVCSY